MIVKATEPLLPELCARTKTTKSLFRSLYFSLDTIYIYISYQTYHISGLRYTTILLVLKYETIMVKRPPNSQSTCSSEYELKPDIESDDNDDENEIKAQVSKAKSPKKARVQKSPLKPKKDSTPVRHIPPKNHSVTLTIAEGSTKTMDTC